MERRNDGATWRKGDLAKERYNKPHGLIVAQSYLTTSGGCFAFQVDPLDIKFFTAAYKFILLIYSDI